MALVLSWVWSLIAGFLSVLFLALSCGALISTAFAVIGMLRRRCNWKPALVYLAVSIVTALFFRSLLWVSDSLARNDSVSTALFWGAVLITGLGVPTQGLSLLRETWTATNASRRD